MHNPNFPMESISDRLNEIRGRLAEAALRSGRAPEAVELLAVSKTFPESSVREAMEAGQMLFGESRVQEAEGKIPGLPARLRWHFIGHLQGNKVRRALSLFEAIHSVSSLDLALAVDRLAGELGLFPKVFLQANLARESSKFGFTRDDLVRHLDTLLGLERVQILGLMAIPPLRPDPEESRADFAAMRRLRDELVARGGVPLPGLSMGMSDDFPVAVEEGATIVRVGSALFGRRPKPPPGDPD